MIVFKWIFRLIKAALFGAICGTGGFVMGAIIFGILQLFCGWSKENTYTIIYVFSGLFALWAFITIIRNGIEDDANEESLKTLKDIYKKATGEEYKYVPTLDKIDNTPPVRKPKVSYEHSNAYGLSTGFTRVNGGTIDNFSVDGYTASLRSGNDIVHFGTDGIQGGSTVSKDGKTITHYGKDFMRSGYSKEKPDGTIEHFDKWGRYKGSSKKR